MDISQFKSIQKNNCTSLKGIYERYCTFLFKLKQLTKNLEKVYFIELTR